ncbi:MAG: alpha/beta hydrolase, partial [Candidatus Binatia bacterium]
IPALNYPIAYLVGFWAKIFLGIDLRDVSPAERIRDSKLPILLIHSSGDAVIPFAHARVLQRALANNPRAEFWFHQEFAHGQLASDYRDRVTSFFDKNL